MKWKKRWPPAHNRAATIQLRWISFHSTPFRFIHSLQLIVCCAPLGGGPRAPFTNSIDSLFVLLHWFINSSIPQRQITQVNWFVHFTFILASFIVHFVCFVWLLSLLCGAVRQLPPLTHPKSKSTKQTHFTIHSAHQQFNLAFLGWAWKAKEKLEIELMVGWVALFASLFNQLQQAARLLHWLVAVRLCRH